MSTLPFTWRQFEREIGSPVAASLRRRLLAAIERNSADTWRDARSIVVAPQLSIMGQTLWQCAEAITLTRWPDGTTPPARVIVRTLCYAAGIPDPTVYRRP